MKAAAGIFEDSGRSPVDVGIFEDVGPAHEPDDLDDSSIIVLLRGS